MKIGQLDQHCGNCSIVEYCAEPFDDLCLCAREDLENIEESEYIKMANEIQLRNKRNISNKKMADRICKAIRKGRFR